MHTTDVSAHTPARAQNQPSTEFDGLSQVNPSSETRTILLGREAIERQRRAWSDWLLIGEAIEIGRTQSMRAAHTNLPIGKRYETAMAGWLAENGFKEIDKGTRSRLLECLAHRAEIETWRASLTANQRFTLNHPNSLIRKWKNSTVVPNPDAPPKVSAIAKLKESIVALEETNSRLQREIDAGGGDLWVASDRAADIARVMLAKLGPTKAATVANALLDAAKGAKLREQLKEDRTAAKKKAAAS